MSADGAGGGGTPPAPPPPAPPDGGGKPDGPPPSDDGRHGLVSGLSALRAVRGASGERLDAERDAVSGLRVQAGQVFGGNSYVYNMSATGAALRSYRLSAEEIDEVQGAFVPPPGFDGFLAAVRSRPLVLLRAPEGAGKAAAARAALDRLGHRTLLMLDTATDLARMEDGDLPEGAGMVLADLPQSAAERFTAFELRRLEGQLRGRNCRLVVTVGTAAQFPDPEVQREAVTLAVPPAAGAVAEAHLRWRLGPAAAARGRTLLARPDVRELLRTRLDGAPAADGAELGRALADAAAVAADDEVAARALERQELADDQALATWFEGLPGLAEQVLAIAVAAFGGEAYEIVATLAQDLEDRLQVEESVENPDRPRGTKLGGTRSARLAAIRGTLVESEVSTRHGGARGKVVRFRDPTVARKVLDLVWNEYDEIREAVPGWLCDAADSVLATVGVRAAVAAGVLTGQAFESVRSRILLGWANSEDTELRDAAAVTLGVAAGEGGHAEAVRNLVAAWSHKDVKPELQATAVRAWRVVYEGEGVEPTWLWLHQLAEDASAAVIGGLYRSLTEYMAWDGGRHRHEALDLIGQWISGAHGFARRLTGTGAFLFAAGDLVERRPPDPLDPPADSAAQWPSLLAASAGDPALRTALAELWRSAVNSELWELAHEALTDWAYQVEHYPTGRRELTELIAETASDPRTRALLAHRAQEWIRGAQGRSAPLTGTTVLDRLSERRAAP